MRHIVIHNGTPYVVTGCPTKDAAASRFMHEKDIERRPPITIGADGDTRAFYVFMPDVEIEVYERADYEALSPVEVDHA